MSEQLGWRSVVQNIQAELPYWGKILPQVPRLLQQQLQHHHDFPLNEELKALIKEQQRQTWWLRIIGGALVFLILFQLSHLIAR